MDTRNILIVVAPFLVCMLPMAAQKQGPSITDVLLSYPVNQAPQLTILGSDFGEAKPNVSISGIFLFVQTFTPTNVTVQFSASVNLPPGTYTITLVNNSLTGAVDTRSTTFPVTLGAVGPAGPPGPQGPAGPDGPSGTSGTPSTSATSPNAPAKSAGSDQWITAALPGTLVAPWTANAEAFFQRSGHRIGVSSALIDCTFGSEGPASYQGSR